MKTRDFILLGVGVGIGYFIFKTKENKELVQLGDKSKEVKKLQEDMNYFLGKNKNEVEEDSLYSKKMMKVSNNLFSGTNALVNNNKGAIKKDFINDINLIINNLK